MLNLQRTMVDKFKIEDSLEIDEIFIKKDNIITIEQYFSDIKSIELDERKMQLFLNGVQLTFNFEDGLYKIYNKNNVFIGIGKIKENLLKRDIIL